MSNRLPIIGTRAPWLFCQVACILLGSSTDSMAQVVALKTELVISSGLSRPIYGAAPAGDLENLYIADEVAAVVRRLNLASKSLTTVLNLPDPVAGGQTGLNGFAFHPDFANTGKIYVNLSGNAEGDIKILEYTRSVSDPSVFDPNSEREILSISNPTFSHNGGWLEFGPHDGYLYLATGDGGNVPPKATKGLPAQDLESLKGKLLRIDVDGEDFYPDDDTRNYAIPPTNPFASGGGAPEIFAYGLRHPFRNGFDRETGDLYIADVGSSLFEEINYLPAGTDGGQNFGWRPREGFEDNPDYNDPTPANALDPIHAYEHGSGAAVIGGYVYRGPNIAELQGTYFFTDFVSDNLHSFRYDGNEVTEFTDREMELASSLGSFGGIASFAEDASGELYILDYLRGDVYQIVARTSVEAGDYNQDGIVDAADYTIWRDTLGQNVDAGTGADGDGDGVVGGGDYEVWNASFGRVVGGPAGAASLSREHVPEPSTLLLAGVFALTIGGISRRREHVAPNLNLL